MKQTTLTLDDFAEIKEEDFVGVKLQDLIGDREYVDPASIQLVAKAIIEASEGGKKPVNLVLRDPAEFGDWATNYGNGSILNRALSDLGYTQISREKLTEGRGCDGILYILERDPDELGYAHYFFNPPI